MKLVIDRRARRRLQEMPAKARSAMLQCLHAIAADPFAPHPNVTALVEEKDAFRLRQGGWRALYRVERGMQEVRVYVIAPRGSAYR